jgi:hypothetical protein
MIGLVAAGCFFSGVLACLFFAIRRRESAGIASKTRSLGRFFHERVSHFKTQVQTLHEHSLEYTAVFSNGDWESLQYTIAHLEQVDAQIQGLLVTKQFEKAHSMLTALYDLHNGTLETVQANLDSFTASAEWESQVRSMLKRVVQNLESASTEISQLSEPQRRKRTPTLETLADVKKRLLEDEAIYRELQ